MTIGTRQSASSGWVAMNQIYKQVCILLQLIKLTKQGRSYYVQTHSTNINILPRNKIESLVRSLHPESISWLVKDIRELFKKSIWLISTENCDNCDNYIIKYIRFIWLMENIFSYYTLLSIWQMGAVNWPRLNRVKWNIILIIIIIRNTLSELRPWRITPHHNGK